MNYRITAVLAAFLVLVSSLPVAAEDRLIAGQEEGLELMGTGIEETLTSPDRIVVEVGEDVRNFGVGGIVTGGVAGGVKAAGKGMLGAGKILVGFMDVITRPIRESTYNRNTIGGLRAARPAR